MLGNTFQKQKDEEAVEFDPENPTDGNMAEGLPEELQLTESEDEAEKMKRRDERKSKLKQLLNTDIVANCCFICLPCMRPVKCLKHFLAALLSLMGSFALLTYIFTYIIPEDWFSEKVDYVLWLGVIGPFIAAQQLQAATGSLAQIGQDLTEHVNVIQRTYEEVREDIRGVQKANRQIGKEVTALAEKNRNLRITRRRLRHRNEQAEREADTVENELDTKAVELDKLTAGRERFAEYHNETIQHMQEVGAEVHKLKDGKTENGTPYATSTKDMQESLYDLSRQARQKNEHIAQFADLIQVLRETGADPIELEELVREEQRSVVRLEEITIIQEVGFMRQIYLEAERANPEGITEVVFKEMMGRLPKYISDVYTQLGKQYSDYRVQKQGGRFRIKKKYGLMEREQLDLFLDDMEKKAFLLQKKRQPFVIGSGGGGAA